MKKITILIYIFFLLSGAYAQSQTEFKKHKSFNSGEELVFQIRYGFIHGGEASASLNMVKYDGKTAYHARVIAQSKGVADKLFSVRDIYESYFDPVTCLPYKAIRNIKEGNYRYYNEVFYTHQDCTLYSQRSDTVLKVPVNILDMVSTLYYIRSVNMEKLNKGGAIEVITYFGDEIFPFKIRYSGKEDIKTKFGIVSCYRFDPVVEPGRIFKSEDDMTIWISNDQNLLPVLIRFNMWIGSVKCELDSYTNLKYKFTALKTK